MVLSDDYDPLIAGAIAQTPATWPVIRRIRTVLVEGLRLIYDTERDTLFGQVKLIVETPALRDRVWADQIATQQLILQALSRARTTSATASGPGLRSRHAWPPQAPPSSAGWRATEPPNCPT